MSDKNLIPDGMKVCLESGMATLNMNEAEGCLEVVLDDANEVNLSLRPIGSIVRLWVSDMKEATVLCCFTESGYMLKLIIQLEEEQKESDFIPLDPDFKRYQLSS
ncbi:MAG: hypothetical protein ACFB0C_17890 [Leptolyngbyaceae cyanobacterium]